MEPSLSTSTRTCTVGGRPSLELRHAAERTVLTACLATSFLQQLADAVVPCNYDMSQISAKTARRRRRRLSVVVAWRDVTVTCNWPVTVH